MTYLPPSDALMFDPRPGPLECGSTWCMRHGPLGDVDQRCNAEHRPTPALFLKWDYDTNTFAAPCAEPPKAQPLRTVPPHTGTGGWFSPSNPAGGSADGRDDGQPVTAATAEGKTSRPSLETEGPRESHRGGLLTPSQIQEEMTWKR